MTTKHYHYLTAAAFAIPAVQFFLMGYTFAAFAFILMAYGTGYYHYYDEKISAGFDHATILTVLAALHTITIGADKLWWLLFTYTLYFLLSIFINEYLIIGLAFTVTLFSYSDIVGLDKAAIVVGIFGIGFFVQRWAEQYKYNNTKLYNIIHSIWHVIAMVAFSVWGYFLNT